MRKVRRESPRVSGSNEAVRDGDRRGPLPARRALAFALAVMAAGLFAASAARASYSVSGDVLPASDPLTWILKTPTGNTGTEVYVGKTGIGSMAVDNGTALQSNVLNVGSHTQKWNGGTNSFTITPGSGTVSVTGTGSTWTTKSSVSVGDYGTGTLTITNGGVVETKGVYIGRGGQVDEAGTIFRGSGTVTVDGTGSGLVASTGFTVGDSGTGRLAITNGGSVTGAKNLTLGTGTNDAGSSGTVVVDGSGSVLSATSSLIMGHYGKGTLIVTNGGRVTSEANGPNGVTLGSFAAATGTATVNGKGSTWTATGDTGIIVGRLGTGKLSISDGGVVTASTVSINSTSTLTTDVGRGSSLAVDGALTNNGTVRLVAGANAASGTYAPVTAGSWGGGGMVQALGGVLNADHSVTVKDAVSGTIGTATTIDLAAAQRIIFSGAGGTPVVGAGFQAGSGSLSLTATSMSDLSALQALLASGQSVLGGWIFTADGYTEGSPVYLSLFAGSDQDLSGLSIWHYDGTSGWTAYDASDLAYDGAYASFTATGFSGYAVAGTAPVPLPAAAWLLGPGLVGLVGLRRRFGR